MISIVNFGMGNVGSISNMLTKIGVPSKLVSNPEELLGADKIILPGVGAFDHAMSKLNNLNFSQAIIEAAGSGIPLLGICLGMQLLGTSSEEGEINGLNLIPGKVVKFKSETLKIPHMGWNEVKPNNNQLYSGLADNRFYFVHSYYFQPEAIEHIAGTTEYVLDFAASLAKDNIYGAQFHPEKSHKFGMQFLTNFASLNVK